MSFPPLHCSEQTLWVEHLRHAPRELASSLLKAEVVCHRFVIGELACGLIRNRNEIFSLLRSLPSAAEAEHDEVMDFLERNQLMEKGLGLIDVHLMASAFLIGFFRSLKPPLSVDLTAIREHILTVAVRCFILIPYKIYFVWYFALKSIPASVTIQT